MIICCKDNTHLFPIYEHVRLFSKNTKNMDASA